MNNTSDFTIIIKKKIINKDPANLNQHFEKGRSMSSFFYQMLATFNELKIMSELYMTTEKGFN
jgi:hypothetical protein